MRNLTSSPKQPFFSPKGVLWLLASLFLVLSIDGLFFAPTAIASATSNHDEYCACGPKCRREKCCCKPSEPERVELGRPGDASPKPSGRLNKLFCLITSPCSEPPASSEGRVARVVPPTAASLVADYRFEVDSEPLDAFTYSIPYSSDYVAMIDRPPEFCNF